MFSGKSRYNTRRGQRQQPHQQPTASEYPDQTTKELRDALQEFNKNKDKDKHQGIGFFTDSAKFTEDHSSIRVHHRLAWFSLLGFSPGVKSTKNHQDFVEITNTRFGYGYKFDWKPVAPNGDHCLKVNRAHGWKAHIIPTWKDVWVVKKANQERHNPECIAKITYRKQAGNVILDMNITSQVGQRSDTVNRILHVRCDGDASCWNNGVKYYVTQSMDSDNNGGSGGGEGGKGKGERRKEVEQRDMESNQNRAELGTIYRHHCEIWPYDASVGRNTNQLHADVLSVLTVILMKRELKTPFSSCTCCIEPLVACVMTPLCAVWKTCCRSLDPIVEPLIPSGLKRYEPGQGQSGIAAAATQKTVKK